MCEREDDNLRYYVRASNFFLTFFIWVSWLVGPDKIITTDNLKIGIIQVKNSNLCNYIYIQSQLNIFGKKLRLLDPQYL